MSCAELGSSQRNVVDSVLDLGIPWLVIPFVYQTMAIDGAIHDQDKEKPNVNALVSETYVGGIMSGKAFIYRNERESLNDIYAISQATSRMKSSFRILLFES